MKKMFRSLLVMSALGGAMLLQAQSDVIPPSLSSITIAPAQINVSSSAATFSVDLGISDNATGFTWGWVGFKSPSGRQDVTGSIIPTPTSGTAKNGVFRAAVTIPQAAESGTWNVYGIVLQDGAGNMANLQISDLTARRLPSSVAVVAQQSDINPPALNSISITPNQVNVGAAAANLSV